MSKRQFKLLRGQVWAVDTNLRGISVEMVFSVIKLDEVTKRMAAARN